MTSAALPMPTRPVRLRPRVALARAFTRSVVCRVPVEVRLPDGARLAAGPSTGPSTGASLPVLELVRPEAFFERLADHPKIGIGEGYVAGDWRAAPGTDLAAALLPFAERLATAVPPLVVKGRRLVDRAVPEDQRHTLPGSRRDVAAHDDLTSELFATFLDESMTYSSALFSERTPWAGQSLVEAQLRKIDAVLDLARVGRGTRVLEIGTGWGALAVRAAGRGARVVSLTLSEEQAQLARDRVAQAGFAEVVDVRLQDYREAEGSYDAVVSVEMIEAVGEEHWPTYFAALDRLLAPGGVVAIQSILMSHQHYRTTRNSYGWIQKHIFPGGLIPSARAIEDVVGRHTTLRVEEINRFGPHYAETLRRWRGRFTAARAQVEQAGFDDTFQRTWEFYLAYCQAGFAAGHLDVAHLRLERVTPRGQPAALSALAEAA